MEQYPKRKRNRIEDYDYSLGGAYYITVCTAGKEPLFWREGRGELRSPADVPLSDIGKIVEQGILDIPNHYEGVFVDQYCIMPDHVHLILRIDLDGGGRSMIAPTEGDCGAGRSMIAPTDGKCRGEQCSPVSVSRIIKQFKGIVTKRTGRSIWQKSFYDHCIRNERDYREVWEYIEQNPLKYLLGYRRR